MSAATERLEALADTFVECLERLAQAADEKGRGTARAELARLKRCAGRDMEECQAVFPLLYRMLPGPVQGKERVEEDYLLVATLFPAAPGRYDENLGHSLRELALKAGEGKEGIDRRVRALLDSGREMLPFRLRQVVRLLASQEMKVSWRRLLVDLQRWEWENRPVQREWARAYFGRAESAAEGTPTEGSKGE